MTKPRGRFRFITGAAIGTLCAIIASTALAAAPTWNRDLAGAPGILTNAEPASLKITVRTCPPGFDPTRKGADLARDCREPAGDTNLQLSQDGVAGASASTGTSGDAPQASTVGFTGLTAGIYKVSAMAPAEIGGAFIGRCASDSRSFDGYPFIPFAPVVDGNITLVVARRRNTVM